MAAAAEKWGRRFDPDRLARHDRRRDPEHAHDRDRPAASRDGYLRNALSWPARREMSKILDIMLAILYIAHVNDL